MNFSAEIEKNRIVVKKIVEDKVVETWSKSLKTFQLGKVKRTPFFTDKDTKNKLFLWCSYYNKVLIVFSKKTNIRCLLDTEYGAFNRLIGLKEERVSVFLSKKGLDIQWKGCIDNPMNLRISDVELLVGSRASQFFDMPDSNRKACEETELNTEHMRIFHFDLQNLIDSNTQVHSRIEIRLKVNDNSIHLPLKRILSSSEELKYSHVPITSFYYDNHAVQLRTSAAGIYYFTCRPMEAIEYNKIFRFWESCFISGILYHVGFFIKQHSSKKVALFFEKFSSKAEEGCFEIFQEALNYNKKNAYFIIDIESSDYERIKKTPNVVKKYSPKYYWLLFRANTYISTETPFHVNLLRSNNRYFRKTIAENKFVFLQHGITYLKYHGKNSTLVKGKETAPAYITVNSDKEKKVVAGMLGLEEENILKTGMPIFGKIDYNHISQESKDVVVIMLTWKPYEEYLEDIKQTFYFKYLNDIFMLLSRYFPKKNIIIVLHPRTHRLLDNEIFSSCIWEKPISEALCQAKLLITDYSSVCYNTFYQGGGVVFFQKDLKYYEKQNGKLIPKDDEYIGKRVFSFESLRELLDEGVENGRILLDRFRTDEFEQRYLAINEFTDGKNIERICKALKDCELI